MFYDTDWISKILGESTFYEIIEHIGKERIGWFCILAMP